MTYSILRDVFYQEIIATLAAQNAVQLGKWYQATGEGATAPVSMRDVALCAATQVYGVPIEYVPVTPEERYAMLDAAGVPRTYDPDVKHLYASAWRNDEMVSAEVAVSQNYLAILTRHVEQITGRPAIKLRSVMAQWKGKSYEDVCWSFRGRHLLYSLVRPTYALLRGQTAVHEQGVTDHERGVL